MKHFPARIDALSCCGYGISGIEETQRMIHPDHNEIEAVALAKLSLLQEQGLMRRLAPTERLATGEVRRGGRPMLSFCDNDYLGLSSHPRVIAAAVEATQRYGTGSGAARLVTGDNPLNEEVEGKLAKLKDMPACRVFGSGWLANLGAIPAIVGPGDLIVMDELCHASMHAAAKLSGAKVDTFPHNDANSASHCLQRKGVSGTALLLTETVFSMDGDLAPLKELHQAAMETRAWMMTDDAHGLGVVKQDNPAPIQMGTLSKALGGYGGYVAGPRALIEWLTSRARSFVYTTGLPPGVLAAASAAIDVMKDEPELRLKALSNARLFGSLIGRHDVQSCIVPVRYGEAKAAMQASEALAAEGFLVTAIRPPTVPAQTARLRITFSARHEEEDVRRLAAAVLETLEEAS